MEKLNLSDKVLDTIKNKKIQQKSRWEFLLRDYTVWVLGSIALIVGALAFSVVIYMIRHSGWTEYRYVSDSFVQFLLLSMPYFWIGFLVLFVVVADYNIKQTKKGYRYRLPGVVFLSILASCVLGTLFYNVGMGGAIDDILSKNAPFYREFINPNLKIWNQPEKGLLSGKVISKKSNHEFDLRDINNIEWVVFCENCLMPPMFELREDSQVNLIGEKLTTDTFRAEIIKPMGSGRGYFERGMMGLKKGTKGNDLLIKERLEEMPMLLEKHPGMRGMFRDHFIRHKGELELFFEETPDLRDKMEELNIEL